MSGTRRLEVRAVRQNDPLAAPLLAELAVEYSTRYEHSFEEQYESLVGYPEDQFAPPDGALLVLVEDGVPVAGGAFQRYDENTAELKRIWTSKDHRRRGLGRIVVAELESEALRRGYTRIYLTTGWRQPEAVALYLAAGYTALFDSRRPAEEIGPHPFEKFLVGKAVSA
ncbi:GNAT family N-acetyltransferase [Rhodococcus pyridinivorans]|nr:GNAT family N-acetyltransferase [Rhodococcus pyridinivorans]